MCCERIRASRGRRICQVGVMKGGFSSIRQSHLCGTRSRRPQCTSSPGRGPGCFRLSYPPKPPGPVGRTRRSIVRLRRGQMEEGFAGADVLDKQTTVGEGGSRSGQENVPAHLATEQTRGRDYFRKTDKAKAVACGVRRKTGRGIASGGFQGQANCGQGNVRHENPGRDAGIHACPSCAPPARTAQRPHDRNRRSQLTNPNPPPPPKSPSTKFPCPKFPCPIFSRPSKSADQSSGPPGPKICSRTVRRSRGPCVPRMPATTGLCIPPEPVAGPPGCGT